MKMLSDFAPMTDLGNAERFVERFSGVVRFAEDRDEWFVWQPPIWKRGAMSALYEYAKQTARLIEDEAVQISDEPVINAITGKKTISDRQRMRNHATATESRTRQDAMLALASRHPAIACHSSVFDAEHWQLNTPGGVYDLHNDGDFTPHDPKKMHTLCTSVAPNWFQATPTWDAFLTAITCGDTELRAYLQRACGMTLIGEQRDHVFLFLFGDGRNGKGTFLNLLCDVLGTYAMTLAPDVLVEKRNDSHPTELADLEGKRMAIGTEVPRGSAWNEVRIKMLSGGDKVRARRMRQDFFEFPATHTFWVSGNDKPRIKGTDAGIWRRVRLVPFAANIPDNEVDPDLPAKLHAEAPGILSWVLDGCALYLQHTLGTCEAVSVATDDYKRDEDILGNFIEDCCIVGTGRSAVKSAFREQLRTWLDEHEYRPISDRQLKADLFKRGIVQSRVSKFSPWEWVGIGLREGVVYGTQWGNG